jgi:hypothetical protein
MLNFPHGGLRFVQWQETLKPAWDFRYFEEAVALLASPLARETALRFRRIFHALPLLLQKPPRERTEAFVRWLGFPCPCGQHPLRRRVLPTIHPNGLPFAFSPALKRAFRNP